MPIINTAIVGASGYTGKELISILHNHPNVSLKKLIVRDPEAALNDARSNCLVSASDLVFDQSFEDSDEFDVIFFALPHYESVDIIKKAKGIFGSKTVLIDLSQDHRFHKHWQYGLSEWYEDEIASTNNIANPGCFATGIQLSLAPLAKLNLKDCMVFLTGLTGSTGAGKKLASTSHYSERNSNVSVYKLFEHQHMKEVSQSLSLLGNNWNPDLHFVPMRAPWTRGIFLTIQIPIADFSQKQIERLYREAYQSSSFVRICDTEPTLKSVVGTNFTLIKPSIHQGVLHISACFDNLVKGASGQAVQNMNIRFNFEHTLGLDLKPIYF